MKNVISLIVIKEHDIYIYIMNAMLLFNMIPSLMGKIY